MAEVQRSFKYLAVSKINILLIKNVHTLVKSGFWDLILGSLEHRNMLPPSSGLMNKLMMEGASLSETLEHILQNVQQHHHCGENLKYHNPSKVHTDLQKSGI